MRGYVCACSSVGSSIELIPRGSQVRVLARAQMKRKIYKYIIICIIYIISVFGVLAYLNTASVKDLSSGIPATWLQIVIFLILLGLLIIPKIREFLSHNEKIVNIFLVLLTIIYTLSIYYVDQSKILRNTNYLLFVSTNINKNISTEILSKINKGYVSWVLFLVVPYEQNIIFIGKNSVTKDCADARLKIIPKMQSYNSYSSYINSLNFNTLEIRSKQVEIVSDINKSLDDVIKFCTTNS